MRVSTHQLSQTMQQHMSSTTASMNKTLMQLGSDKAISKPSDDPLASLQVMALEDHSARLEAYEKNIHSARNALDMTETLLGDMNTSLNRTRELVLAIGGSPVSSDSEVNPDIIASVKEIESLIEGLADIANSKGATGEFVFGGTKGDQPAILLDDETGQYKTTDKESGVREIQISDSQSVSMGVQLTDVLGEGDKNILNQLTSFKSVATDPNTTGDELSAAIADTLEALDSAHSQVNGSLTKVGASLNTLKMAEDSHGDMKTFNQAMQDSLENVDVAEATMDFAMQQHQLAASQKAYAMVNSASLFDYL